MSSPFNPLTALTPAGVGGGGGTPQQQQQQQAGGTPSLPLPPSNAQPTSNPLPSNLLSLPTPSYSPPSHPFLASPAAAAAGLSAFAGLPGMGSVPGLAGFSAANSWNFKPSPAPSATLGLGAVGGVGLGGGPGGGPWIAAPAASAASEADLDDALRAIPDAVRLVERAEALRAEIGVAERGATARAQALQLEYAQSLLALISLCSGYLLGALPVPLSSATGYVHEPSPSHPPNPLPSGTVNPATAANLANAAANATATAPGSAPAPAPVPATNRSAPNTVELADWSEARAQAQFARREAVRAASKAVVDVLKGSAK